MDRFIAAALLILAFLSSAFGAAATAALPADVRVDAELVYATRPTGPVMLDLYRPAATAPLPVVVWIHGGGWINGTRSKIEMPSRLLPAGYAIASISYRFAPKRSASGSIFPAQIEDCRSAVRWLRAHAQRYGLDGTRIGVWGGSAGGHLAALLGTAAARTEWDVGEHLDQSSAVQAVCDWFGVTQFLPPETPDTSTERARIMAMPSLFSATPASAPALARAASPITHITADCPPFLIMHGDKDTNVWPYHSQNLHAALRAAGVDSTFILVPGAEHKFTEDAEFDQVRRFFDRCLGPSRR